MNRNERGFTLVELLVAMVIVGIIVFSVGTALLIGLRTVFATGEKLRESGNAQLLAGYFVPDVQSSLATGVDTSSSVPTGCAGSDGAGTNVVRLQGLNNAEATFVAAYRRVDNRLERHACSPGGAREVTVVVRDLLDIAPVSLIGRTVSLTITVDDPSEGDEQPFSFSVRAAHRTPAVVCEPLLGALVLNPVPAVLSTTPSGDLASNITATFTTAGSCSSAAVVYQYGATGVTGTATASSSGSGNWSAVIPKHAAGPWTAGTKSVVIAAGGRTVSSTFDVYDPAACSLASSATLSPSSPTVVAGLLLSDVQVNFTTSGTCAGSGSVTYQYGATAGDSATVTATKSGNTWSATLPMAAPGAWTPGTKAMAFSGDSAAGSRTFTVTAPANCAFVNGSLTPNTTSLRLGEGTSGQLSSDLIVRFRSTGLCSGVTLTYQYAGSTETATVATAAAGVDLWEATLPAKATLTADWTAGLKELSATSGTVTAPVGSLTVAQGCALTSALAFDRPEATVGSNGQLDKPVLVTFSTTSACNAADLVVDYQHGAAADRKTASPTTAPTGSKNWTVTLPDRFTGGAKWTAGDKNVFITVGVQTTTANPKLVVKS